MREGSRRRLSISPEQTDTNQLLDHELLRAAFRDVHGTRLHGFALLVALGDRPAAADAAGRALADGALRAHELRHPERAAAWLRARVARELGRRRFSHHSPTQIDRQRALHALGVDDRMFAALSVLNARERTALVVSDVERLDGVDAETVLGIPHSAVQRLANGARERYLHAYLASASPSSQTTADTFADSPFVPALRRPAHGLPAIAAADQVSEPAGALAQRVRAVAVRALAPAETLR
jgi:DNA-directed RNA polymerase specialized sigma24 family protein